MDQFFYKIVALLYDIVRRMFRFRLRLGSMDHLSRARFVGFVVITFALSIVVPDERRFLFLVFCRSFPTSFRSVKKK